MSKASIDPSSLVSFGNVAAGHDGVLSDPTGALVIKPCTPAEVAFYESVAASHPALAAYMPTFMGTLQLNKPAAPEVTAPSAAAAEGTAATLSLTDPGPMHGKKLETETSIVLENIAAGFKKPNILDLKLGARLYDDDTKPEKRARLDKVSNETTSSSLGFRIAGMRVWQGSSGVGELTEKEKGLVEPEMDTNYKIYNKLYGRVFDAETVVDGFKDYFLPKTAGIDAPRALKCVKQFRQDVLNIQGIFEERESRMYGASILFVYEGDPNAFDKADGYVAPEKKDDEEEGEVAPRICAVKMIDFAHAQWVPGQGPDENAIRGMRNVVKILQGLEEELAA